ncbi:Putative adhesin [Tenacibaculum sp. MAR_2009_124]|uniref:DUF4097 family beta strand repeat-containing protein n=1 Tax=Tenacibaculum sp. MAR_2009_124 TaxID=1250059 RepID=UPI0008948C49|nr:DUF4097 family beta strand repeat-containing protein [Tenacibaculum sp. MAR_2009_124]SEC17068.1 Putative adhesin [Tenacibaculum sp. MAR_2009_124]
MKRIFLFIGMLLSFSTLYPQKKVELKENTRGITNIDLKLDYANKIDLKNWDKNELFIKAIVNLNNNSENDLYSLKSKTTHSSLSIHSDYANFFEKYHKQITTKTEDGDCNNSYYTNHTEVHIDYVIFVPKNMTLKIKSITGSVDAQSYDGKLKLDLISGDITIKKYSTDLDLKTISGEIDLFVSDAKFRAETLTGTVYSNLDIDFNNREEGFGHKISGKIKSGKLNLKLKSISGDIFLRKPQL